MSSEPSSAQMNAAVERAGIDPARIEMY